MQLDGGLFHLEFLLGEAVVDFGGFALEAADNLLFRGFEAGALDGEVGVGEFGAILIRAGQL